ncbi:hypothetical protein [Chromobacterium sp. IIBBL 290-4]|uniref:hypothetical protein n=1 Tax=Chromobacterium sp. IIBBL 290-4 TaxID=2953890 RepID=UPI0020B7A746|nr:hypothetical protein [Chromobacterium sp. IIBBL 290-4]UTH72318.1 hypothetical protein NKT35_12200 [Chromobacterium sp. IIBBL 290-4]
MKNDACMQHLQLTLVELPDAELRKILNDYRGYIREAVSDRASENRLLSLLTETRQLAAAAFTRRRILRRSKGQLMAHGLALLAAAAVNAASYWVYLH